MVCNYQNPVRIKGIQNILEKEKKMAYKIDIKRLIIGLLVGLVALSVLGATSGENKGIYQLSMAASSSSASGPGYIIYGRIHTGTGKVETWKYLIGNSKAVPHLGDDKRILVCPSPTLSARTLRAKRDNTLDKTM
jgi:hypothetical protein